VRRHNTSTHLNWHDARRIRGAKEPIRLFTPRIFDTQRGAQVRPLFAHNQTVVALATGSMVLWQAVQIAVSRRWGSGGRSSLEWSFVLIIAIASASIVGSIVVAHHHVATISGDPWWPVIAGLILISIGSGFRTWAIATLGHFFKIMVVIQDDHHIVERGPYRHLRHPAYLGSTLAITGFGLTEGDWVSVAILSLGALLAFVIRIRVEERALLDALGEPYAAYAQRTSRLIPGLY
jgi:protein-S-isoprenylcysteine O-methyltransferase Ste14